MRAAVVAIFLFVFIFAVSCINVKLQTISPQMIKISNNLAPIKEGCIVIYSNCDFDGEKKEICVSVADLRKLKFDKKVSSVILGKNTKIILRQLYDYKGNGLELTSNIRCLENKMSHWNKNISSIIIQNLKVN